MTVPEKILAVYQRATCIYTRQQISSALDEMAQSIHQQCSESNPVLLCVVIGGIVPLGNLLPRLDFPLEVDYIHASRYHGKTSGGAIDWIAEPRINLQGRDIIIVDDILDGGITLSEIIGYCKRQSANKIYSAVLLDKTEGRVDGGVKQADFVGLSMKQGFVFGYGMDYQGYLRNAPGIYEVAEEDM